MIYTVRFKLPPAECSPNFRGHTQSKAEFVRAYRGDCALRLVAARIPPLVLKADENEDVQPVRMRLDWHIHRRHIRTGRDGKMKPILSDGLYRPRDEDNARGAFKAAQDALVDVGVLPDDTSRYLALNGLFLHTKTDNPLSDPGIIVTLEVDALPIPAMDETPRQSGPRTISAASIRSRFTIDPSKIQKRRF